MDPTTLDKIIATLAGRKFNYGGIEAKLQEGIQQVLEKIGVPAIREHPLGNDRIDFYLPADKLGIEAKVGGSLSALTRQLHRYAASDELNNILVVSTRSYHRDLPQEIRGKGIRVVILLGGAF